MEYFAQYELYAEGMLDVGDGHSVHWTASGNSTGVPALIVHGGPGSGSSAGHRRMWDPDRYRVIQMDQRNCGQSTPPAADPAVRLSDNTTAHLLGDMEQLREHLGIDQWVLWGGSWGTTLALVYAEKYPERVHGLILVFMMLGRMSDFTWLYQEMGRYFPAEWARFRDGAGGSERDMLTAYNRLLNDCGDEAIQRKAALDWSRWEGIISSLDPGWEASDYFEDPDYCLQFARITTHYFSNGAWLEDDQILRDAHRLRDVPGVIIHGREDRANPYDMAWSLADGWPAGEFVTLHGAGHTPTSPLARDAVLAATCRFADRLSARYEVGASS